MPASIVKLLKSSSGCVIREGRSRVEGEDGEMERALHLPVKIGEWIAMALVDSGAEANLISDSYLGEDQIAKLEGKNNWNNLVSYTGDRINVRGRIDLWVQIAEFEVLIRFTVVKGGSRVLLGVPFLRRCGIVADFGLGWLYIRRKHVQMYQKKMLNQINLIEEVPELAD